MSCGRTEMCKVVNIGVGVVHIILHNTLYRHMEVILMGRMSCARGGRGGGRGGGVPQHAGPLLHRGPDGHAAAQRPHGHGAPRAARGARARPRRRRQRRAATR